jgi:hypothetical protein
MPTLRRQREGPKLDRSEPASKFKMSDFILKPQTSLSIPSFEGNDE